MRRLLLLSVLTAAALPGAASAQQTAALEVSAELLRQPKGQPWAINLGTKVTVSTPDGGPPAPLKSIDLRFPRGAQVNAGRFPTCDVDELRREGRGACPRGSRIGRGTALVDVRPLLDFPIDATIDVYNGPRRGRDRILIFDAVGEQVPVQILLQARLRETRGRYGYRLRVEIPEINTIPGANDAAISTFQVEVGARRGRHSFIEAPRRCPRGGWLFAGSFGYYDGTSSSTRSAIGCTLTSEPVG